MAASTTTAIAANARYQVHALTSGSYVVVDTATGNKLARDENGTLIWGSNAEVSEIRAGL